jgi:hypothetical protein
VRAIAEAQVPRLLPVLLVLALLSPAFCQHKADPAYTHERLICVVPMIGSGTHEDPRRPMFAPIPGKGSPDGILAFAYQLSDDGQHALVEFVARARRVQCDARHSQVQHIFGRHAAREHVRALPGWDDDPGDHERRVPGAATSISHSP